MVDERRAKLQAAQESLMRSLVGREAVPAGFDQSRIEVAAKTLAIKRAQSVRSAWPALSRYLGESFSDRFNAYANDCALPREGGPLADGRAFIRMLACKEVLPGEVRLEALAVDLRYRQTPDGLTPRRGFSARAVMLRPRLHLIVALRAPFIKERWFRLRLR
jgi:hypothetical protein